jgi:hypothetical protein
MRQRTPFTPLLFIHPLNNPLHQSRSNLKMLLKNKLRFAKGQQGKSEKGEVQEEGILGRVKGNEMPYVVDKHILY